MRILIAAIAAALLILTGCGEKAAKPKPLDPTEIASPSPSVSAAPEMPAAAKKKTKAGAEAFVRYYVELINHAQATGETERLDAESAPGCSSCAKGSAFVHQVFDPGGSIEGGLWKVDSVVAVLARPDIQGWVVDVLVSFGPQTVRHADGRIDRLRGGKSPFTFTVTGSESRMSVAEWTRGR